jgi:hypothetical protein
MAATHDDAVLIVQLSQLAAVLGVNAAVRTILAPDFDPQTADTDDPEVQTILNFSETIATLVKHRLLDRELVQDWIWLAGFWERLGPAAERARRRTGAPSLYENLEALAASGG